MAINGTNATLSLTAFGATSDLTITATIGGVIVDSFKHKIEKVVPTGAVSSGGGGGGSNPGTTATSAISGVIPNTQTYVAVTGVIQVVAGTAGTITCLGPVDYTINGMTTGGVQCYYVWRWRVVGGTFADIATEGGPGFGSTYSSTTGDRVTTSMNANMTKSTGLTSGVTYEVQLFLRGNTARSCVAAGTSGANASASGS
jgi:hypothetical protein